MTRDPRIAHHQGMPWEAYLVRRSADGTMRTFQALSLRDAAKVAAIEVPLQQGEVVEVKKRGEGGWKAFSVTRVGVREI